MCVNFVYDLNGAEGPNQVGKDVGFITALYNKNSVVVAPMPYKTDYDASVPQYSEDSNTIDAQSACKVLSEDLRLPDKDELASLFINVTLIEAQERDALSGYWSSSVVSVGEKGLAWSQSLNYGDRGATNPRSNMGYVRCVYK